MSVEGGLYVVKLLKALNYEQKPRATQLNTGDSLQC